MTAARPRHFRRHALGTVAALAGMLGLTACQDMQDNPKSSIGAVLGGVAGAVVGSQFGGGTGKIAATAAGTLLGAYVGSEIGKSLDRADRAAMGRAQDRAHNARTGETIRWDNPDSGHSGTITPVRDGRSDDGAYCREYRTTVNVDWRNEQAYGTACRQPDGTWKIVQ